MKSLIVSACILSGIKAAHLGGAYDDATNQEPDDALVEGRRTTSTTCFTDGSVKHVQKLSALYGYWIDAGNGQTGYGLEGLGDLDGDGVEDLAVGVPVDGDGGTAGAVYVLFLETSGNVKSSQKISMLYGNFNAFYTLHASDQFGTAVETVGDLDGDGVVDLAVGSHFEDDGGSNAGAMYILFLETNGIVKNAFKSSAQYGNFNTFYTLDASDLFGGSLAALGDIDGDSVLNLAVGARGDGDGGLRVGAVYVLTLETNGNVKNAQKISMLFGNFNVFILLTLKTTSAIRRRR